MSGIASQSPAAQQCKARPMSAWPSRPSSPARSPSPHVRVERPTCLSITTALSELLDAPDTDPPVKRGGHDVADLHGMAGSNHPAAVDPHATSTHEPCGCTSRLDDPRMPEPLVNALP